MSDWNKRIGQYAKARREESSDVDKELQQMAMAGRYGYEQAKDDDEYILRSKIYQSYDQREETDEETTPSKENEAKDSYDTISINEEEDNSKSQPHSAEDHDDDIPITKGIILELIVCILAFIGRGLCLNSVGPTLIDLRQIVKIKHSQSAFIFISQSAGFFVGSILAKPLLQRFNNELVLAIILIVQAVCTAFIPAFRSMVMMCLMFVGQGLAIGVVGIGVCATCIRLGGKKRNGMFLQAVYLGVSIGSVLGPFIARPFLSTLARHTDNHDLDSASTLEVLFDKQAQETVIDLIQPMNFTLASNFSLQSIRNTTEDDPEMEFSEYTETKVHFYYVIIALILGVPAGCFFTFYFKKDSKNRQHTQENKMSEPLSIRACTVPLTVAISLLFLQCLMYFGIQDTYSNLLTTFAVLGPLKLSKAKGVYLTSLFWASMAFGRLNGIWIAKFVSPFKMLLVDLTLAFFASSGLLILGGTYSAALWGLTVILGLAFASVNGATVSWAAAHLPENNWILSVIMVGRCIGLLILPTVVTAVFKVVGAMSLMSALFTTVLIMLISIVVNQILAHKFGQNDKLHTGTQK